MAKNPKDDAAEIIYAKRGHNFGASFLSHLPSDVLISINQRAREEDGAGSQDTPREKRMRLTYCPFPSFEAYSLGRLRPAHLGPAATRKARLLVPEKPGFVSLRSPNHHYGSGIVLRFCAPPSA